MQKKNWLLLHFGKCNPKEDSQTFLTKRVGERKINHAIFAPPLFFIESPASIVSMAKGDPSFAHSKSPYLFGAPESPFFLQRPFI